MRMKNVIVTLLLAFISMTSMAQKARFGVKTGLNLSDVTTDDKAENKAIGVRPAFHLGLVADLALNDNLSFQPQLLYSGRGAKEDHEDHKDLFKFNSLEIPLNLVYRTAGSSNGRFFLGGGPSIGYNLGGKVVATDDPSENTDFEFGSAAGQIRRMDIGLNLLAGYELKGGFFVSANYTRGLTNWLNTSDKWRNNVFALSVGYFFKSSVKK
jgi:hypothetical protein